MHALNRTFRHKKRSFSLNKKKSCAWEKNEHIDTVAAINQCYYKWAACFHMKLVHMSIPRTRNRSIFGVKYVGRKTCCCNECALPNSLPNIRFLLLLVQLKAKHFLFYFYCQKASEITEKKKRFLYFLPNQHQMYQIMFEDLERHNCDWEKKRKKIGIVNSVALGNGTLVHPTWFSATNINIWLIFPIQDKHFNRSKCYF